MSAQAIQVVSLWVGIIGWLFWGAVSAAENAQVEVEGMSVMGSNEQPQVLYIVPWQPPSYQKRTQHPPNNELSDILKPIEPLFHKEDYSFRKKLEVNAHSLKNSE